MRYKLCMNGLDCANCAGKIEKAISETEGFENVSLVFATKALYFEHAKDDDVIAEVQQITDSIEDGVTVTEYEHRHNHKEKSHCHDGHCGCHEHEHHEHDHDHHHEHDEGSRLSNILLFVAIGFGVAALVLDILSVNAIATAIVSAVAIILSGYKVCINGVKSLFRLRLDETTLMTIAVIAAFCLGQFAEGAMVTILFGIGEMLEDKAVESSRKSIEKLANIQADTANVVIDGVEKLIDAEDVAEGSDIIIKPHERIPLDCVVTDGEGAVDASAISGESIPLDCKPGVELLSGMMNGDTLLKARTTKSYHDSTASRIIKLVEEASVTKSRNEKLISRFASVYTPIVTLLSIAIALIPPLFLGGFDVWIYRGLVCLVASCPCAIVISVPLAYYSGIGAASKQGILIKGGRYLEALAACDTVVFDKTGTLTEGELEIVSIVPYKNYTKEQILALAAGVEKNSGHPIARAIVEAYSGELPEMTGYSETTAHGVTAAYNGRKISCGGRRILPEKYGGKPSAVYLLCDGELIGEIEVRDKLRAEAADVTKALKKLGVKKLVMLTGDDKRNADAVSAELGLDETKANLLPQDKLEYVNSIKSGGRAVSFVGDGINDAPVITAADCGFAMGLGSDAAIASADAVLTSGNLSGLPRAFRIARKTVSTAKTNIIFALLVKAAVIVLAFFGLAAIWMSVIADTGVCMLCVLWAMRILRSRS